MTRRTCYQMLRLTLEQAGLEDAAYTAQLLLEHVTGLAMPAYLVHGEEPLSPTQLEQLQQLTAKRLTGYPLQYLLQSWEFYGLELSVGEGVLIPRQDTETIVEFALSCRNGQPTTRLLDLCSGSGCIPLAIAAHLPGVTATAVEYAPDALHYLTKNIQRYPAYSIQPIQGDAMDPALAAAQESFDLITCNPPYLTETDMQQLQREVTFEPASALYGGSDGLDYYRRLTAIWSKKLLPGGWLIYEIGKGQEAPVTDLLRQAGLTHLTQKQDGSGIVRLVAGQADSRKDCIWQKN